MTELTIEVGKNYRAKKPRKCLDGGYNDRTVLYIDKFRTIVQYDSPTVANGRHYPKISMEQFVKWAGKEISDDEYLMKNQNLRQK